MRIASWNCHHGECRQRAASLDHLDPDLVVLQECSKPTDIADKKCVWFGNQPRKGVGIVARGSWFVERGPVDPAIPDSVYPVRIHGPVEFNLLAIWAQKRPTYVRAIFAGLASYRDFLMAAPSVVVGDFNSHPRWDADDPKANHSLLAEMLRQEFGLVSAYHAAAARLGSDIEEPTFYLYWKETQPFHLDYCFIPTYWASRLCSVKVGSYAELSTESDHRPLIVEFAIE